MVRKQLGCTSKEAVRLIMQRQQRLKGKATSLEGIENIFQPCLSPDEKENRQQNSELNMSEKNVEEVESNVNIDTRCSILSVQEDKASAQRQHKRR